ncbi:DUF4244 domain-containing protein [Desertihabitans brevis]|uniref:DUF4244 domain-containing protein n=1 Tax=Desertihabitans brevis TaxID=2268447 RepID=UPI001F426936|nr:DUF4244 domain-containing protein [Desertihabitans brevis]
MSENTNTVVEPDEVATDGHDERGMTTAEYAVGTVATVGLGGVLISILTSEELRKLIVDIFIWILGLVLNQNPF